MRIRARHAIWAAVILLPWAAAMLTGGVLLRSLYLQHVSTEEDRLEETAKSWARLVEAIANVESGPDAGVNFEEAYPATLSQIREAHSNFEGFGETGEFTFAWLDGDQIVFLVSHRYQGLDDPSAVPMSAERAEPMRRALSGDSGAIVGLDYRGQKVLAAFEVVRVAGHTLGIVAKIDLVEVRRPFVRAGSLGMTMSLALLLLGVGLVGWVAKPLVQKLDMSIFMAEQNPEPVYWVRKDSSIGYANAAASRQLGYTVEELMSMEVPQIDPDFPKDAWAEHWDDMKEAGHDLFEAHHRTKSGRVFRVDIVTDFFVYDDEEFVSAHVRDTSEREAAEEAKRRTEVELRLITDNVPAFISYVDTDFTYRFVNRRYQDFFGLEESEIIGRKVVDLVGEESYTTVRASLVRALAGETVGNEAEVPMGPDGERRFLSGMYVPDVDPAGDVVGIFCLIMDITERKRIETQLLRALEEKSVLLREIHHRVKNILQVISSLLYLQSARSSDPETGRLFLESRDRVHVMALAHQLLYETDDLARIDFGDYVGRIAAALASSGEGVALGDDLDVQVDCGPVDIHLSIQIGLIVNELLTNIKYAYPNTGPRPVRLSFTGGAAMGYTLEVRDWGVGLPARLDIRGAKTLGLRLVHILADQLSATVDVAVEDGTHFTVHIPPEMTASPA